MSTNDPFCVSSIAIIGAGPSGLAFAKHLLSRPLSFRRVIVFEQSTRVGGVWNYSPKMAEKWPPSIPYTDPLCGPAPPLSTDPPTWSSPMYETLYANIPASLMQYGDVPFPALGRVFPDRETVRQYLEDYADGEVRRCVWFGWSVQNVRLLEANHERNRERWEVTARNVASGRVEKYTFDAAVVANGHYSIPYVPPIPLVEEYSRTWPGAIRHASTYRAPKEFAYLKTVVVGNGPSGLDIARQLNEWGHGTNPPFLSVRHPTPQPQLVHSGAVEIAEIASFAPATRGVVLVNGALINGIDAVIFCTGYMYNFPFLPDLAPSMLGRSGKAVRHMYRHLFHAQHPTLVFPGLQRSVVPFPLAEAQAAAVASVWANHLALPDAAERERWCEELERDRGDGLDRFEHGEDGRYINELWAWWRQGGGRGREPPFWDARQLWERTVFAEAKLMFEKLGREACTLEELGLRYPDEAEGGTRTMLTD